MKPVGFAYKSDRGFQIVHKCLWCGCTSVNEVTNDTVQLDDTEALGRLSSDLRRNTFGSQR